jgi:hypothetical protein
MKRLIQRKERASRTSRTPRQKKIPATIAAETPLITPEVTAEPEQDPVAAAIQEEPLPFVMAEMALWGTAMSALMIPIGVVAMIASPFAVARDMWRSRGGHVAAEPVVVAA